jgi:hypothetical protein
LIEHEASAPSPAPHLRRDRGRMGGLPFKPKPTTPAPGSCAAAVLAAAIEEAPRREAANSKKAEQAKTKRRADITTLRALLRKHARIRKNGRVELQKGWSDKKIAKKAKAEVGLVRPARGFIRSHSCRGRARAPRSGMRQDGASANQRATTKKREMRRSLPSAEQFDGPAVNRRSI